LNSEAEKHPIRRHEMVTLCFSTGSFSFSSGKVGIHKAEEIKEAEGETQNLREEGKTDQYALQ